MTKTVGQRLIGDLNPDAPEEVTAIKTQAAKLIDVIEKVRTDLGQSEKNRYISLAQTAVEQASMWAVKAATLK